MTSPAADLRDAANTAEEASRPVALERSGVLTVTLIWLAWAAILFGFQAWVTSRLQVARPDYALDWTPGETRATSQNDKPYLMEPFLNSHVSWDSEFYLSIATFGYDDPLVRTVGGGRTRYSMNYAFMPFYPLTMRVLSLPLRLFGLNPIATATLAGVLVSLFGTLAAMIALYDLLREELEESGAIRAAFYLIAFPAGFFLAQVYTEGLFVGLAFSSLALARRGHRGWAALLAVFATWTRVVGIALVIPLAMQWFRNQEWQELDVEWKQIFHNPVPWKAIGRTLITFSPVIAYLAWRYSPLGVGFDFVESNFFRRGFLSLGMSFASWGNAFWSLWGGNPQASAYYLVEFGAIVLALVACWRTRRTQPDLAWFSLAVVLISLTSGPAQGMHRYVLAAPALFAVLAHWGRRPAFDRAWTLLSILLMGAFVTLFSFDMWAG